MAVSTDEASSHPDAEELASFFYKDTPGEVVAGKIAAHVAVCRECSEVIAVYAHAELLASEPGVARAEPAPQKAWELIRDWEGSAFTQPKAPDVVLNNETLNKLLGLMRDQTAPPEGETPDLVPVLVVDNQGEFRRVEMFEKKRTAEDAYVFEHLEKSEQFDSRSLHAVLELESGEVAIVAEKIERYRTLLQYPEKVAGFFIFED
jgi:hypothetical protein